MQQKQLFSGRSFCSFVCGTFLFLHWGLFSFTFSLPSTLKPNKPEVSLQSSPLLKNKLPFTSLLPLPSVSIHSDFGSRAGTFQSDSLGRRFLDSRRQETRKPKSQSGLSLSSVPPALLISASSAGVCQPPLSQTDVCLPVYCSWPGRLVGVQASALSLTLWNTTAVRLLPDSMLIVRFNSPMFNHEEKWRQREIMIISLKFFCVGSHLYTFRMRCHFQHVEDCKLMLLVFGN